MRTNEKNLSRNSAGPLSEGVAVGADCNDDIANVEALMESVATGARLDRLGTIVNEHLASGGKRIRAKLALAACSAMGVPSGDAHVWAAACELLHNATLVHDDLQDGDRVRRGSPTTWALYGAAQAINAGDLMLMLPYLVLDRMHCGDAVRWRLSYAIARMAEQTVRGQAAELELREHWRLDREAYDRAAEGKTAGLLALPVAGAAILAGRDADAGWLAEHFGNIGLLFQLQDDLVDLYGDKGRGERGADLREGKISALVVEHVRARPEDRDWIVGILSAARDETRAVDIQSAAQRFNDSGAVDAVLHRIRALAERVEHCGRLRSEKALHAAALRLIAMSLAPIRGLMAERDGSRLRNPNMQLGLVALAGI